jgi:hypothetical protein
MNTLRFGLFGDFGWGVSSRGRFATPADFPLHDCSSYRGLHARRESLELFHRSSAIFCRFSRAKP